MEKENNHIIEELLFNYFEKTASFAEQEQVRSWLEESENHQKIFDEFAVLHHWFSNGLKASRNIKEASWNKIKAAYYKSEFNALSQNHNTYRKKIWIRFAIPAAASLIFIFLAEIIYHSYFARSSNKQTEMVYNEVFVPLGARSQVTLSDGTKVWLNAGSKLKYPMNFSEASREVNLEGEAYFDVVRMKDKLFIVKTSDINIKVYGTKFNVKSYPEENIIQTTLVEGSLSVEPLWNREGKEPVYLKPNQSLTYYKPATPKSIKKTTKSNFKSEDLPQAVQPKMVVIPSLDPLPITSWKDNKWVIKGERLEDLATKLERRYNVRITFQDESLKNYKFSGTLKEETFEQVLKILQISMPIIYVVQENNVIFREDLSFKAKYDSMINNPNN